MKARLATALPVYEPTLVVPAHVRNATHEYVGPFAFTVFCVPIVNPFAVRDWMRFAALVIGVLFAFVWIYGGYHAADIAVAAGKRWLFFLGLGIISLYLPLYAYRRFVEDRRFLPSERELNAEVSVASETDSPS